MTERVVVTGATGFIGARLAARLASSGREVCCLVRDRGGTRARELVRAGFDVHGGDVLRPETLRGAGHRVGAAYYLIHSMGAEGYGYRFPVATGAMISPASPPLFDSRESMPGAVAESAGGCPGVRRTLK